MPRPIDRRSFAGMMTASVVAGLLPGFRLRPARPRVGSGGAPGIRPLSAEFLGRLPQLMDIGAVPGVGIGDALGWGLGWGLELEEAAGRAGAGTRETAMEYLWQWGDNGSWKNFVLAPPASTSAVVLFTNGARGLNLSHARSSARRRGVSSQRFCGCDAGRPMRRR